MQKLEIKRFKGGLGVLLPNETLQRLNVEEGGNVFLCESPDGDVVLTSRDPEIESQLARAEDIMQRYRKTLHALAK